MNPIEDYPYRFERTATAADLQSRFESLGPQEETEDVARIAGRIRTVRTHGKVAFADLEDATGRVQLFAQYTVLGDEGMESFGALGVGDIVGAEGVVVRTKRGELSLRVTEVTSLAKCLRPMPDKWHEMTDVERRYRQRYLDMIGNPTPRRALEARARTNSAIRKYFDERGFVEVETPLLQPIASGAVARPFVTHHNALDIDLFLRVAPELYLKRLLIGGAERIYELNRSFRNEGISTKYNPEFTMLEAYEAYVDYNDTMTLVEDLARAVAQAVNGGLEFEWEGQTIDLGPPFRRVSMFDAMAETTGRNLQKEWEAQNRDGLKSIAEDAGVRVHEAWGPGKVLAEIFEATTERTLVGPTYITGFPKEVSPLAKDHRTIPGFTEQADLIICGVELAPVYSELNDPEEQKRRFEEQARHAAANEEAALPDADFVEALAYGMPPAGGFGLGVDRLLTLLLGLP
ncbi:MAG: lysine--tRNA ligase, partial [Actinomycetota bacterium]|nr:lysine--tRNA ligase [Actinomycetota bacterium]